MTLWIFVISIGAYHGLNPGMGWPLALSNGLFKQRQTAVFSALLPLAAGHFLAMAAALLPFALLAFYLDWDRAIRIGAGLAVLGFGLWRMIETRHPRVLSRIRPTDLTLWSFVMATAHGAGLMLIPVYASLCASASPGSFHAAIDRSMRASVGLALAVVTVHTIAALVAGGTIAWGVYRWFGPRAVGATWFNLDRVWAASLILSGAVNCATALAI